MKSTHLRCCASPFPGLRWGRLIVPYDVRLIPQGAHALYPVGFTVGYADLEKRPPQEAGADLKKRLPVRLPPGVSPRDRHVGF